MKTCYLTYIFMAVTILLAFLLAPRAQILGDTSRILYFHVPMAWISVVAFITAGIYSILYLLDKKNRFHLADEKAHNAAQIGIVFTVLTTVTGSMWAKLMWGSYWNWDPRETSILILLLMYIAYFSLRSSIVDRDVRARVSSSYLILSMVAVPFFVFLVPRLYPSLHPDPVINSQRKLNIDMTMRIVLLSGTVSFTLLYACLFRIRNRITIIHHRIEENLDED